MALGRARGWDVAVLRGEVAAWEDVGRGERGGRLDAVEEKDLVFGRYQEDALSELLVGTCPRWWGRSKRT